MIKTRGGNVMEMFIIVIGGINLFAAIFNKKGKASLRIFNGVVAGMCFASLLINLM
jgi:hypothetical protein